jgi:hypothetical protein
VAKQPDGNIAGKILLGLRFPQNILEDKIKCQVRDILARGFYLMHNTEIYNNSGLAESVAEICAQPVFGKSIVRPVMCLIIF